MGDLDLTLYTNSDISESFSSDNVGRLWYSLAYDEDQELLIVSLIKAKNIPVDITTGVTRESFFRYANELPC